jgi:hypothetical protein
LIYFTIFKVTFYFLGFEQLIILSKRKDLPNRFEFPEKRFQIAFLSEMSEEVEELKKK